MRDYSENDYDMATLMQEAIECLPNGLCIMDKAFRPIISNQHAVDAFPEYFAAMAAGADLTEANFAGVRRAYPNASDQECWGVARIITDHVVEGKTINLIARDGRAFRAKYKLMDSGCYVAVYVDISDLKRRERELDMLRREAEAANRAKSVFLANMSHEIRTPLNGILGMAQSLVRDARDADLRDQVEIILESGNTLKSLLDDVLDLSKIETGHMDIAPVETDLMQVLRRQHSLWMPRTDEKDIALVLDVAEDVPAHVRIDPIRLGQCLSNLVSNAIKFTERGEVRISVSTRTVNGGAGIAFAISDTGIGMDAATIGRLFTPFAQADSSISRRFGGTGLGLVITRRLAQLMGGDVTVESRQGRGTTFTLTIAAEAADCQPPASPLIERYWCGEAPDGECRILVVDDHAINRRVARMLLAPEGYRVTEAENGQQALEALERGTFDVMLLDIHMPVLDGVETLKRLRASGRPWAGMPVIAVTADAMSGDRERYLAEGMNGYIAKPIERPALLAEVARLLVDTAAGSRSTAEAVSPVPFAEPAAKPAEQAAPSPERPDAHPQWATRRQPPDRCDYKIADLVEEAIDVLPDGFAIFDADMRPIMANRRSRQTFTELFAALARGLPYSEANYVSCVEVMKGHSAEEVKYYADRIEAAVRAGEVIDLRPSDGRIYRTMHNQMSRSRCVAVSIDVTDERRLQKKLEESRRQAEAANRAKTVFLANMSHEIRTPLNGILGMAQVMAQGGLPPAQREQAEAILDSGKALKSLLDDVLDLAKIDAGRLEMAPAACEFRLLQRQLDKWRRRAEAKGLRFLVDKAPSVPNELRLDPVRVGQCVSNLLSNAVKFTEPGGEIRVGISVEPRPEGVALSISVADTGIGISEEMRQRMFSPFSQGDSSITRRYGGTGLGLVITQKLAALMGGDVRVDSEEGRGSVFTLKVLTHPVDTVSRPRAAASLGHQTASEASVLRVLFVDDHAINRRIGRLFLEPEGHVVTEAADGPEALALLRDGDFDMVFLDVHMPVLDGLQTLQCIRKSGRPWAGVPVVALVADAVGEDCQRYLGEGMDGVVGKPIEQRNLLAAVSRVCGARLTGAAGAYPTQIPDPSAGNPGY
jgi:signal transduction histidine kinase/DNA-binding response OmpR family regulator